MYIRNMYTFKQNNNKKIYLSIFLWSLNERNSYFVLCALEFHKIDWKQSFISIKYRLYT